jgi:hypothetical protein
LRCSHRTAGVDVEMQGRLRPSGITDTLTVQHSGRSESTRAVAGSRDSAPVDAFQPSSSCSPTNGHHNRAPLPGDRLPGQSLVTVRSYVVYKRAGVEMQCRPVSGLSDTE